MNTRNYFIEIAEATEPLPEATRVIVYDVLRDAATRATSTDAVLTAAEEDNEMLESTNSSERILAGLRRNARNERERFDELFACVMKVTTRLSTPKIDIDLVTAAAIDSIENARAAAVNEIAKSVKVAPIAMEDNSLVSAIRAAEATVKAFESAKISSDAGITYAQMSYPGAGNDANRLAYQIYSYVKAASYAADSAAAYMIMASNIKNSITDRDHADIISSATDIIIATSLAASKTIVANDDTKYKVEQTYTHMIGNRYHYGDIYVERFEKGLRDAQSFIDMAKINIQSIEESARIVTLANNKFADGVVAEAINLAGIAASKVIPE